MKIWQRAFFFKTLSVLFFFLIAFSALYVLIDYASHTGNFHHHQTTLPFKDLALFYTGELIRRSEVLLPFAILIATIRVITQLNTRNELVALLAAGISLKKLMRPFVVIGLLGVTFLYFNEEFLIPWSMENAKISIENNTADRSSTSENITAHPIQLEDGTLLIFQQYRRHENLFFDVWWVKSINEIWRMKTLGSTPPYLGEQGEILRREPDGALVSKERFKSRELPQIRFNQKRLLETLTPAEDLSISELASKLSKDVSSQKEARIETAFWRKMILPWLALLAVVGTAPMSVIFSRRLNVFAIYTISLFGMVFVYILLNAATTLSERQVLTPLASLIIPFSVIGLFLSVRWVRMA